MFHIYLIFNTRNGKVYVGKTNDLHTRWVTHKKVARGGKEKYKEFSVVHRAIVKYGIENFEYLWLQTFSSENDAYLAEDYWINYYNSRNNKFGYNASPGGIGVGSGVNSANFGLKRSPETIAKLRESHLGDKNQNTGKIFSPETRRRMSVSQKGNQLGEKHPKSILTVEIVKSIKIDFKNGLYKKEISRKYNINYSTIISVLNGQSWSHVEI
jgi:group I intron endonuclease